MLIISLLPKTLAYIDPGTGSLILQALVATVVGAGIAGKLFWHRILNFWKILKGTGTDLPENPGDTKK